MGLPILDCTLPGMCITLYCHLPSLDVFPSNAFENFLKKIVEAFTLRDNIPLALIMPQRVADRGYSLRLESTQMRLAVRCVWLVY